MPNIITTTTTLAPTYLENLEHCISLLKLSLRSSSQGTSGITDVAAAIDECVVKLLHVHERLNDIYCQSRRMKLAQERKLAIAPRYFLFEDNNTVRELTVDEARVQGLTEDEDFTDPNLLSEEVLFRDDNGE